MGLFRVLLKALSYNGQMCPCHNTPACKQATMQPLQNSCLSDELMNYIAMQAYQLSWPQASLHFASKHTYRTEYATPPPRPPPKSNMHPTSFTTHPAPP